MASVVQDTLFSFLSSESETTETPSSVRRNPDQESLSSAGATNVQQDAASARGMKHGPGEPKEMEGPEQAPIQLPSPSSQPLVVETQNAVIASTDVFEGQSGSSHEFCRMLQLIGFLKAQAMRRDTHRLTSERQNMLNCAVAKLTICLGS